MSGRCLTTKIVAFAASLGESRQLRPTHLSSFTTWMIISHGMNTFPQLIGTALADRVIPAVVVTGARQTDGDQTHSDFAASADQITSTAFAAASRSSTSSA